MTSARFAECARPDAVRQSIKLADATAASGYRGAAPSSRNFKSEGEAFLVSSNSRFVAWDSRRAAIWIRPWPPNQFHEVLLTIEGVRVCVLE